jgi:hypothetical protein
MRGILALISYLNAVPALVGAPDPVDERWF